VDLSQTPDLLEPPFSPLATGKFAFAMSALGAAMPRRCPVCGVAAFSQCVGTLRQELHELVHAARLLDFSNRGML